MEFDLEGIMREEKHLMFFNLEEINSFEKQICGSFKEEIKKKILDKTFVLYFNSYYKEFNTRLQKDARERGHKIVAISEYLIEEEILFDLERIKKEKCYLDFENEKKLNSFLKAMNQGFSKESKKIILNKDYYLKYSEKAKGLIVTPKDEMGLKEVCYKIRDIKNYIIKEKKEENYFKIKNKEKKMGQSINIRAKIAMVVGEKLEIKEIFEENIQEINEGNRTAKIGGVNYENVVQIETDTKTILNYKEPKLEIKDTRGQWVAVQTEILSHKLMAEVGLEEKGESLEKINELNEKLAKFSPTIETKIKFKEEKK